MGHCTNADGSFYMDGLPLDTDIHIYAGGPGWGHCPETSYAQEYWQESPSFDTATAIVLTTGTPDVTGKNFTLDQGGTISGKVTTTDGINRDPRCTGVRRAV